MGFSLARFYMCLLGRRQILKHCAVAFRRLIKGERFVDQNPNKRRVRLDTENTTESNYSSRLGLKNCACFARMSFGFRFITLSITQRQTFYFVICLHYFVQPVFVNFFFPPSKVLLCICFFLCYEKTVKHFMDCFVNNN